MRYTFLDSLDMDTWVITAGQRLSRALGEEYTRRQRARGLQVWERAHILPWATWLQTCWEASTETVAVQSMLLAGAQERTLWERVIAESEQADALLQVAATARIAQEAWRLTHERRLSLAAIADAGGGDARAFAGWAQRYAAWCDGKGWLDAARLPDRLMASIAAGHIPLPRRLFLAGFDELSPQQTALLQAVSAAGCEVLPAPPMAYAAVPARIECVSGDQELLLLARWARTALEADPAIRIGIVVPDLAARRAAMVRRLDEVLAPASRLPQGGTTRAYNLSLGLPLSDYPVVRSALLILELAQGRMPLERLGGLLRSPFLAAAEHEMTRRGLLDARIRRMGETMLSARGLWKAAQGWGDPQAAHACPRLAHALQRWLEHEGSLRIQRAPSDWAGVSAQLLAALGWPGERTLSSEEYQAVEAWRDLLSRFSGLDAVWPTAAYASAVTRLRRMAGETLFQPQTPEVPIQVLGVLEAAGMQFDHLWIMGLTDEVWPPPPRPNPFLPAVLQRRHGVPHASAERELEFAQRVTARLLTSAPHIVVSHARRDGERDLRVSPLIADLAATTAEALAPQAWQGYAEQLHTSASALEAVEQGQAPPVAEGTRVRGGTGVFKQQAACPFRAFAEYRLGAVALDEPEPGLNAAERGTLLHAVLEQVWDNLTSQANLLRLSVEEERQLVEAAVTHGVARMATARPQTFTERFLSLEKSRLARLVHAWLVLERERAAFSVIKPEVQGSIVVGGLTFSAQIDRIDRLEDGSLAIVDYKSGRPEVAQWFGERPEEPQLPLYSLFAAPVDQPMSAILFGQVRLGDMRYKGLARAADVAPGVPALHASKFAADYVDWDTLLAAWRQTLTRLAEDFRRGHAPVDPKEFPKTCRYCALTPLCRIHEVNARLGRMSLDEPDAEESADA
jgi:ATP-dependent helicase/nuclease subunit B